MRRTRSSGERYWLDTYITGSTQDRGNSLQTIKIRKKVRTNEVNLFAEQKTLWG